MDLNKNFKIKKLKYLVTGTGRCGTVFLSKLLTSVKIPCGHECVFKYDGIDNAIKRINNEEEVKISLISQLASQEECKKVGFWLQDYNELIADSSYMAAPYLNHEILKDTKIIYLIRNPLKVINSFVFGFNYFNDINKNKEYYKEYYNFISQFIPEIWDYKNQIDRCALFYIKWNEIIAKNNNLILHKIEDDPLILLNKLNINIDSKILYDNKKSNHKESLKDIIKSYNQIPDITIRNLIITFYKKHNYHITKQFI